MAEKEILIRIIGDKVSLVLISNLGDMVLFSSKITNLCTPYHSLLYFFKLYSNFLKLAIVQLGHISRIISCIIICNSVGRQGPREIPLSGR